MERFLVVLRSMKRMPAALADDLRKGVYPIRLKKGESIQTVADHVDGIYFVEKGLVQLSRMHGADKQIFRFMVEDQFIIALLNALGPKSRAEGFLMEALEDCILWHFSAQLIGEMCNKHPDFNRHYMLILGVDSGFMELAGMCSCRENDMKNYYRLREHFPYLLNRVPIPNLANFTWLKESIFRHLHSKKNPMRF